VVSGHACHQHSLMWNTDLPTGRGTPASYICPLGSPSLSTQPEPGGCLVKSVGHALLRVRACARPTPKPPWPIACAPAEAAIMQAPTPNLHPAWPIDNCAKRKSSFTNSTVQNGIVQQGRSRQRATGRTCAPSNTQPAPLKPWQGRARRFARPARHTNTHAQQQTRAAPGAMMDSWGTRPP
jgi:hypothetical protein